jgi:hypothetical protein
VIKEITLPKKPFCPFPAYSDRAAWAAIPQETKAFYLAEAAKRKGQAWPSLPASEYLEYFRNGNRTNYQDLYFNRRFDLKVFAIAECIEGKGEYLDDVINGLWLICEETTWVVPAHYDNAYIMSRRPGSGFHHRSGPDGTIEKTASPMPGRLPDPEDDLYIDLFAAETGSLLSWCYYFLGDIIAEQTPEVKRRMEEEVTHRFLVPFMEHDDFHWMGFDGNQVNNWNAWINSNILAALLIFAPIFPQAEQGVNKAIQSINFFIHGYGETLASSGPSEGIRLSMDIAGAYPASARVKSYKRSFVFVPGKYLELTDTFSLEECTSPLILNLLCYEKPVIVNGKAELSGPVMMEFDSGAFTPEIEEIKLTDSKIRNDWQKDCLYRLRLVKKEKDKTGTITLRFTLARIPDNV